MTKQREDQEEDETGENQEDQHLGEEEEDEGDEESEDGDGGGGGGSFFESFDRVPSGVSIDADDLPSSDSDEDEEDDVRMSFASAVAPPSFRHLNLSDFDGIDLPPIDGGDNNDYNDEFEDEEESNGFDYGLWMAEPMSVEERRRKLLQGMGLTSSRNLPVKPPTIPAGCKSRKLPPNIPLAPAKSRRLPSARFAPPRPAKPGPSSSKTLTKSKSDTQLALPSRSAMAALFRISSAPPSQWRRWARDVDGPANHQYVVDVDGVLKIKNGDNGHELALSPEAPTGKLVNQVNMDEMEKQVGSSPVAKEVMRRVNSTAIAPDNTAAPRTVSTKPKETKSAKKKPNWLKNIKLMTGLGSEKEKEKEKEREAMKDKSNERLKVHQHGKSYKELTGLYMCQEIQAHQGSIWTMKFSCDSRFLASAGEDRVVHVWQVTECDTMTSALRRQEDPQSPSKQPPLSTGRSSSLSQSNRSGGQSSKRGKKGKGAGGVPDNVVIPETIFSLSAEPYCSFEGHLDDVLDLSWSKCPHLLSSSMDKTVRLWDIETKTCLKLFAHNDYVTCVQFNPVDERYFISGSLDAKVRIWSVPDRSVIDWSDLHEMVTATCYTPDGQGALVGSHKGCCRFYNTADAKLTHEGQIEVRTKKKKAGAKKITGFQFAPDHSSEVLITSADSQIRVFDGEKMIHKFRGFRNTSSQISASCTMDGKYVVCASEDSHVYVWKRDRPRNSSGKKVTTRSHEHFYSKDVLVAVPWPNGGSSCEPSPDLPSWSLTNNSLRSPSNLEDMFPSGRSNAGAQKSFSENAEENQGSPRSGASLSDSASSRSGHGSGSSMSSSANSSSSSSSFSSWGWGAGNTNRVSGGQETANAWGLVVVTAGVGGNITVYQNFGVPLRLRGQPNLFSQ